MRVSGEHKKPIKVGLVCDYLAIGGQERALVNLVKSFNTDLIEPHVYAFRGGALANEIKRLNIPLMLGSAKPPWSWTEGWSEDDENEKTVFRHNLQKALERDAIDVVILFAWPDGVYAALQARVPVLIERLDGPGLLEKIKNKSTFDKVICQSKTIYKTVLSKSAEFGLNPNGLELIYSGVDLTEFDPSKYNTYAERKKLGLAPSDIVIGYVGRIHAEKNLHYLMEAVARIDESLCNMPVRLVIAGPDLGELENLKRIKARHPSLENRVLFIDERENIAPVLAALDVFTMFSNSEGVPNAILEAMAMGLPIVASDAGSIHEVVESNALLLPGMDISMLSACFKELVLHPERRRIMGQASLGLREKYSLKETVSQYETLITTTLVEKCVNQ